MWELRHNLNAYDATYVALAEMTGAAALLTTGTRLANAPGINGSVALTDRVSCSEHVVVNRRSPVESASFAGYRFPPEVILLAVRWYLRYGLSYRDVEELLAERGIEVDHVTIYRWVQKFTPLLINAARPCRHAVGDR